MIAVRVSEVTVRSHRIGRGTRLAFAALALSWMLSPRGARADDVDDPAAAAKKRGDELMLGGKAAEALSAYAEAYALRKDPALLYNRGRAYQALGDYPASLDQLEMFDREATPELRARVPGLVVLMTDVRSHVSTLALTCDVAGAEVRLRDRTLGITPVASLRVTSGKGRVELAKDGYFTVVRELELPPGGSASVDVHLVSKQTSGQITIGSPAGPARVTVDAETRGTTPVEIVLAAGSHRLELTRDGYEKVETSFVVTAGEKRELGFPMERSSTLLRQWWFWTGLGVLAVGGTIGAYVALTTERSPDSGSIPPQRISLGRF